MGYRKRSLSGRPILPATFPWLPVLFAWLSAVVLATGAAAGDWDGPRSGPSAQPGKSIVYIAEDLRNAGILGVGEGIREACRTIGWSLSILDIGIGGAARKAVFEKALVMEPDGIILGGMDAVANNRFLGRFSRVGIPVIGWHVAPFPGPVAGTPVIVNVTTDSLEVARTAVKFAIADSGGRAGVVIFTDNRFAIARKKSGLMAEIIESASGCTLLAVENVALTGTAAAMPGVIRSLLSRFKGRWTHAIGINDLYFDHAMAELIFAGLPPEGPPVNISAGDGSPSAFLRIANTSYQKATVPEPLLLHGWQMVDELNRALWRKPASGYVNPPYLVTTENIGIKSIRNDLFDPDNGYRDHYTAIWRGERH